jgi:putative membrane protein
MSPETRKTATLLVFAAACLAALIVPTLYAAAPPTTSTGSVTSSTTGAFGDREILGVLQTVNVNEMTAAQHAATVASAKDVREYAQEMVKDHRAGENGVTAAVKVVGATRTSALSKQLATESKEMAAMLAKEKGAAFDRAYVAAQVKMHQHVLDTIDRDLTPKATHAKVKSLLTSTRATVAEHLDKAKALQAKLGS